MKPRKDFYFLNARRPGTKADLVALEGIGIRCGCGRGRLLYLPATLITHPAKRQERLPRLPEGVPVWLVQSPVEAIRLSWYVQAKQGYATTAFLLDCERRLDRDLSLRVTQLRVGFRELVVFALLAECMRFVRES